MTTQAAVVCLLDVDNTLLDGDRLVADLKSHLKQVFGDDCLAQYWTIFEARRAELGYVDYIGALQRYRIDNPRDQHCLQISTFLLDYPFADLVYPGALRPHPPAPRVGTDGHRDRWGCGVPAAQDRPVRPAPCG